jgi:dienelactone hydrolase
VKSSSKRKLTEYFLLIQLSLLMVTCLAGCQEDAREDPANIPPLTSTDLLAPGPFVSGFRMFTFEDTIRPTMPNGDYEGGPSRVLSTTVWYPAEEDRIARLFGGLNATVAKDGKPFPLIIYCHGFMSWGADAKYLAEHLAGHGYVVACPDFPLTNFFSPGGPNINDVVHQPGDVRFLIDKLLAHHANAGSPLYGAIDEARVGVMGLSLGGMTTSLVTFHPTLRDPRVTLAATLAGPGAMFSEVFYENGDVPLLAVHGDIDAIVDYETNALSTLTRAGPKVRLISILNASHTGFSDAASPLFDSLENPDVVGCLAIKGRISDDASFLDLLGGHEEGIVEPNTPALCQNTPLPRSIRPSRQHELTILAVLSFFESLFAPNPQARSQAAHFLNTTLARENPEIVLGGTGDLCGTCVSTDGTDGCRKGLQCVEGLCIRPGGNLPGECCDKGPATCSNDSYCHYQTCESSPVYPPPKEHIEVSTGHFRFNEDTSIIIPPDPSSTDQTAARLLQDQVRESYGFHPDIRRHDDGDPPVHAILLGTIQTNPSVRTLAQEIGMTVPDGGPAPQENYSVRILSDHILVAGRGDPGVLYGAQVLKQLIRSKVKHNTMGILEEATIEDYPDAEQRMFQILLAHYYVPKDADGDGERDPYKFVDVPFNMDTARGYIHILSELRFNTVIFKVDDMVAWENLPEPQSTAMSVNDFMELVREANAYGLHVVPLLTGSSSSYGWIGTREDPVEYTEAYSNRHYEEHLDLYKGLIQEIIDTFDPVQPLRYFHAGMDEDCEFGPRSLEAHQAWVKESYDLITSNDIKMMLWHDAWLETEAYESDYDNYPEMHVMVWDYNEPVPITAILQMKDVARKGMEVSWALYGNGMHTDFELWFHRFHPLQKGFVGTRWTKEGTMCQDPSSNVFQSTVNRYMRKNADQFWNARAY